MVVLNITEATTNTLASVIHNGTKDVSLNCMYPTFDANFNDNTFLSDILMISPSGFKAGEVISVKKNNVAVGTFTISTIKKAVWLSELTGVRREVLSTKVYEVYDFTLVDNTLLQFKLISAKDGLFLGSDVTYEKGLSSEMYLLSETTINGADKNSTLAIRDAMNKSKTEIEGNNTNIIKIKNTYPIFGTKLPQTYVMDYLITFANTLPMKTEIVIIKNGTTLKTVITDKNILNVYLSDLLGVARETLYTQVSDIYELNFVYNQFINVKIITGELVNFTHANILATQLTQDLFLVADSKTLENIPLAFNRNNFIVSYESYENLVKGAKLDLGNEQYVVVDFIFDNTIIPPKKYLRISNKDELLKVDINILMDRHGVEQYITLIRDMARRLNE